MKQRGLLALLPIGVFLLLFLGSGILTGDFYAVPAIVCFVVALITAFLMTPKMSFQDKLVIASKGISDDSIITMVFIFLLAGAFSGIVEAAGGVDSTVNFALSVIPSQFIVVGLFLAGCFISLSMGTSVGTITALAPVAVSIAEKTGFAVALCVGAVVCGAMFGDNLSMVSDTTIAAVKTQGCQMKDKFKQNFLIVLPAAIITAVAFAVVAINSTNQSAFQPTYHFLQIIPYIIVLIGALVGFNVFAVLLAGIAASGIVGLSLGKFDLAGMLGAIGDGIESMYEITVISILVAAIFGLVKHNGGIAWIVRTVKYRIHSKRGAELGIAGIAAAVDCCTANNTVAIVMTGPIAKEISSEYEIDSRRSASILDIFTSAIQGIIPYGAQLLTAATLAGIAPVDLLPYLYYPLLMLACGIISILIQRKRNDRRKEHLTPNGANDIIK